MAAYHAVCDYPDSQHRHLMAHHALGDVRPDCEHVIDLSTFEPRLTDDGRVLARRTPLR